MTRRVALGAQVPGSGVVVSSAYAWRQRIPYGAFL